jgi:DNA polymerase
MSVPLSHSQALAALDWLIEAGADEAIGTLPVDRFAQPALATPTSATSTLAGPAAATPPASPVPSAPRAAPTAHATRAPANPPPPVWTPRATPPTSPDKPAADARRLAASAATLEALHEAIRGFDGCALKRSATNTVLYRGNPQAKIMLIGEAPGREEDLQGQPFVGAAGRLLDAMLAAIGLGESQVYITNMLYWRPPGNRTPDTREIATCLPFIERQIDLLRPGVLMFLGNTPSKVLLGETRGITKLRGRWQAYRHEGMQSPIPALPTLHPAYLLRRPQDKSRAWRDLLLVEQRLNELG